MATERTEKDITNRSLGYGMGNESKKPKDDSLGYERDLSIEDYRSMVVEELKEFDRCLIKSDTSTLADKARAFLKERTNTDYGEFVRIVENPDYLDSKNLVYLAALYDFQNAGGRAEIVLDGLKDEDFYELGVRLKNAIKNGKTVEHLKDKKFSYRIVHPYTEPINTQTDFVDIEVDFKGKTYRGSVTTPEFIRGRLSHFYKTGENGSGSYFCAEGMLVLRDLEDRTIKQTLDDLVERGDLEGFLSSSI